MAKNNIYTLELDDNLDGKFRELQRRFKKGERIISTNTSGNKMLVTTETPEKETNLLLDDLRAGRMTQFGQRKS